MRDDRELSPLEDAIRSARNDEIEEERYAREREGDPCDDDDAIDGYCEDDDDDDEDEGEESDEAKGEESAPKGEEPGK